MTEEPPTPPRHAAVDYDPFAGVVLERVVPTTEPQREVWLADQLGREASLAYNESVTIRLTGPIEMDALRAALRDLIPRHDALRATFGANGEELCIAEQGSLELVEMDHSSVDASTRCAAIQEAKQRAVDSPFDLESGPLIRVELHRLDRTELLVIFTAHHVVCDGWSLGVLVHDLMALYAKRLGIATDELAPARSFGDYAVAQRAVLESEQAAANESYWLAQFADTIPVLDLPLDHPRSAWRTFDSRREDHTLDADLLVGLRKLGGQSGAGLFATSLSLFAVLLQRLSGEDDLVIGIPAAGQSADGWSQLVGHCVNLLPLRLHLDAAGTLVDAIACTQSTVIDAFEHQSYTMGSLLKKLAAERDPSRPTLVSVMFNIDAAFDSDHSCPGLSVELESNARSHEVFEMFVNAVPANGGLRLECQYNANLFEPATIRAWLRCYETLLRSACQSNIGTLSELTFTSSADQELLGEWNDTRCDYASGSLVHELFEEQVARTPTRQAVVWRGSSLTYAEIDRRANQIAHALESLGVARGGLVGLHVERSPDLVAAMLGVMKVGAAYVPLDPSFPRERLVFMAEDSGLAVIVSQEVLAQDLLPRKRCLLLDADRELIEGQSGAMCGSGTNLRNPTDVAYVIYTSGSTGKPNGVCVPHRAVVNFLASMAREPGLKPADRLVAVTTHSFDIAVNELLLPLTVGAATVIATPEEAADGAMLGRLIESSKATAMQATPATWHLLLAAGWRGDPRFRVLCGGEELTAHLAEHLLSRAGELWNMYGPTETTVWSSCARIRDVAAGISIGRPIANTSIWILDGREQPCPIGVPGEIWIAGDGVTRGYLGRPELTAARFLPDPMSTTPGAKIYRTGDRGRWRADGVLQHLGRLDFQVKVRGYRIELGEIESHLVKHPSVAASVAIARENRSGDVRLVAYWVAREGSTPDYNELQAHLAEALPDYMLPQHLVCLSELPLLPNGKLDRKSLPDPAMKRQESTEYIAPKSVTEQGVAEDLEVVLGMQGVGSHDDFFVLGGHSLLAAQLTYRINRRFGLDLPMRVVFEGPTVAKLAAAVDASAAGPSEQRVQVDRLEDQSRAPASFMQERLWLLERMNPGRVTYHAPSAHRLLGAMNEGAFERAFCEVVQRQPALRTEFENQRHGLDQCVCADVSVSLFPAEDLSQLPHDEREVRLAQRLEELTSETFDLSRAPLFKVRMLKVGKDEHVLFFMPHHIIWDGWSFDLLYQEMSQLYAAFVEGAESPLPPLEVSYCDFAVWHRTWMEGTECKRQLDFWRERMLQAETPRPLPTDSPRQPIMSGEGSTEWIAISKGRTEALRKLAAQSGSTQFVATLTVFGVLLHDFSREGSFIVGTPVRARMVAEVEAIMGYFNNLLLLPLAVKPNATFLDLLKCVRAGVVESFAVPGVPLEQLERALTNANGKSAKVVYQALFSFQDARQRATQWGDLRHSMIPLFQQGATEDLGMWFVESADGLQGGLTYNTDVFHADTARWLVQRYAFLLDRVLANPRATVAELVGLPPSSVTKRIAARDASEVVVAAATSKPVEVIAPHSERQMPAGDLQSQLCAAWQRVLGIDRVGLTDNFFDLGGNSLGVLNLVTEIERSAGIRVDPGALVRAPTIAGLQASLVSPPSSRLAELVLLRRGGSRKLYLIHDGEGSTLPYLNLARHLPADVSVYGVEPQSQLRVPLAITSIEGMATCYLKQVRRHQPRGPYLLGGLCAGGLVAYEMAVQLERAGEQVELVAILDAGTPQAVVKRGLSSVRRRERFWRALAGVRESGGSALSRFFKLSTTFFERAYGALSWAVCSRVGCVWAWSRVRLLRRWLRNDKSWPAWLPALTFHQIYVYAEARYVPGRLQAGEVVLLRPRPGSAMTFNEGSSEIDDTPYVEIYADSTLGWEAIVEQLTIVDVDGGHSSMLWEPHVLSSASALAPYVSGEPLTRLGGAVAAGDS